MHWKPISSLFHFRQTTEQRGPGSEVYDDAPYGTLRTVTLHEDNGEHIDSGCVIVMTKILTWPHHPFTVTDKSNHSHTVNNIKLFSLMQCVLQYADKDPLNLSSSHTCHNRNHVKLIYVSKMGGKKKDSCAQ